MTTTPTGADAPSSNADADNDTEAELTFDAIPMRAELRQAIDEMGWTAPTPVQVQSYGLAVDGKDMIVQARTGTGKTAAFGIPIVDRLTEVEGGPQALILAPTRELALQSAREIGRIATHTGLKTCAVYGGAPIERQVRELRDGAQIISGTPGRVLDHLRRGNLDGEGIKVLCLDEADEMLSMGFAKELNAIMELLNTDRQTLLYSATVDGPVQRVAERHMTDPEFLTLSGDAVGALGIDHFTYNVSGVGRTRDLIKILEVENPESAIIFCNTKVETERVSKGLQQAGYNSAWLNGDMAQSEREKVMAATRESKVRFLVCTDVAARGIDISHLTHVINFAMPNHLEQYVHRTGRTGRAGRTGTAVTLVAPQELGQLYYLRLQYKIHPIDRSLPTAGEERTRAEADRLALLEAAFTGQPSEVNLAVAKRLLTHENAEHLLAGLLGAFFGTSGEDAPETDEDVDDRAAAARRSKPQRRAPEPEEQEDEDRPRRRRRRRRRDNDERTEGGKEAKAPTQEELSFDATSAGDTEAPETDEADQADEGEAKAEREATSRSGRSERAGRDRDRDRDDDDEEEAKLYVNLGRRDDVGPGDINRLFIEEGDLEADQIGRIRIRDKHTFVFVPVDVADDVIEKVTGVSVGDREVVVEFARG